MSNTHTHTYAHTHTLSLTHTHVTYRSVDTVSSRFMIDGDAVMNIVVLLFPLRDSLSRRVSFESRYGMCWALPELNFLITAPGAP
jgi:hypothetical protein